MVKSNKFDYTGRTSSGPKLGKSIASDLEKRADKKQREALKSSSATRLSFKLPASAVRTPKKDRSKTKERDRDDSDKDSRDSNLHKLDLKVPNKSLTDEGFGLLADGLQNALNTCPDLALVDLNLSSNALTTHSLARLAPIIYQSRYNLQTLDLSNNNLQVSTSAEAQEWEVFLQSFHPCMTLRRLDLSDNLSLGPRAFEVLARVYSREPPVDPLPATGCQSFITLSDNDSVFTRSNFDLDVMDGLAVRDGNAPDLPTCANGKTLADAWVLKYRCGLRSIPYLTLTNVGLNDTGALFLSYVLEQHYYPIQLVTENNATEATNQVRTYRQDANTKGIDWDNNAEYLSKDGLHMLQCAEKVRMKILLGDSDSITSSYMSAGQPDTYDASSRRPSGVRRPSIRSIRSIDYSIYDKSDINSARKKIQRNTIIQTGCDSVDLWRASLAAIIQSRKVFLLAPVFKAAHHIEPVDNTNSQAVEPDMPDMAQADDFSVDNDQIHRSLSALSLRPGSEQFEETQNKRSYAATLMTTSPTDPTEPVLAITSVSGSPVVPTVQSGTKILRKGASSRGGSSSSQVNSVGHVNGMLEGPIVRDSSPEDYVHYQEDRMEMLRALDGGASNAYRDASLRCQLPLSICIQILQYSMDSKDLAVLGEDKQRKAFAWGQKRETLKIEYDWRMKDESSQLLMLLAGAECVEY